MQDYVWIIIIGFMTGFIARLYIPRNDSTGPIMPEVLGIMGAIGVTFLAQLMGWYNPGQTDAAFLCSAIGAVAVVAFYGVVVNKGHALRLARQRA